MLKHGFLRRFGGLTALGLLLLILGCYSEQTQNKAIDKTMDNRDRWKLLAPFVMKHFDTGDKTVEEVAADLAYQEYLMNKE